MGNWLFTPDDSSKPDVSTTSTASCPGNDVLDKFEAFSVLAMKAYGDHKVEPEKVENVKTAKFTFKYHSNYGNGKLWCWKCEAGENFTHVFAFRGTQIWSWEDVWSDALLSWGSEWSTNKMLVDYKDAVKKCCESLGNEGFMNIKIMFCGHSLGASVAEAIHCNIKVGAKFENTLGTNVTSVGAVTFDSPGQSDAFRSKKNGFLIDEKVENNDTKKDGPKFKENKDVLDKVWTLNNRPNIVNTLYKPCARHYYVCGITPWLPWSKFIPVFLDLFSLKWHFLLGSFFEINRSHTMKEIGFEIVSGKVARGSKLLLTEALLGIRNRLGIVIGVPAALAVIMHYYWPPFSQLENTIAETVRNIKTFFKTTFELPHLFEWLAVRGFVILSLGCKWLEEDFLYCVENAGPGESTDTRKECSGDVRSKFKAYSRLAMKAYDEPSLGMTANATVKTHQYSYNFFHSYKDGRVWCWIREPQSDELHVAVVVRGTYDIVDMLNNWKLAWGSEASTNRVLKLYYSALKECCEELWESTRKRNIRITFCGHSLGASVAEALHCNIKSEELKKSIHPTLDVQSIGAVTFDSPGLSEQFRSEVKHGFIEKDVVATKENTENRMKPTSACDDIWTLNYQPNVMNLLYPPSTKHFFCCGVEPTYYPPNVFNFFPFLFHEVSVLYKGLGGRMKDILNEVSFDNNIRLVKQEPPAGHFERLCAILRGLALFYKPWTPVVSLIIDCFYRPCRRILFVDAALCICIPFLDPILAHLISFW